MPAHTHLIGALCPLFRVTASTSHRLKGPPAQGRPAPPIPHPGSHRSKTLRSPRRESLDKSRGLRQGGDGEGSPPRSRVPCPASGWRLRPPPCIASDREPRGTLLRRPRLQRPLPALGPRPSALDPAPAPCPRNRGRHGRGTENLNGERLGIPVRTVWRWEEAGRLKLVTRLPSSGKAAPGPRPHRHRGPCGGLRAYRGPGSPISP